MSDLLEAIEIQNVRTEHVRAVIKLLQDISSYLPDADEDELILKHLQQSFVFSVVAVLKEHVVGYASSLIYTNIRGGSMMFIEDVVVDSSLRNRGIGNRLLTHLRGVAEGKGCYKITLCCQDRNIRFYESCGYHLVGSEMKLKL